MKLDYKFILAITDQFVHRIKRQMFLNLRRCIKITDEKITNLTIYSRFRKKVALSLKIDNII